MDEWIGKIDGEMDGWMFSSAWLACPLFPFISTPQITSVSPEACVISAFPAFKFQV